MSGNPFEVCGLLFNQNPILMKKTFAGNLIFILLYYFLIQLAF